MMHRALQGASRQICTIRGLATKNGVRSEMAARISLFKYGRPRITFRGKDESFIKTDDFWMRLPRMLEAACAGPKVLALNHHFAILSSISWHQYLGP
jgi:hypothetical protein